MTLGATLAAAALALALAATTAAAATPPPPLHPGVDLEEGRRRVLADYPAAESRSDACRRGRDCAVFVDAGDTATALALGEAAAAADPACATAWTCVGASLFAGPRHSEAIDALRRAAALLPAEAAMHNNLARALKAAEQTDEALLEYARALDLCGPGQHEYYLPQLVQEMCMDSSVPELERAADRLVAQWAGDARARTRAEIALATCWLRQGRNDDAHALLSGLLTEDPRAAVLLALNVPRTFRDADAADAWLARWRREVRAIAAAVAADEDGWFALPGPASMLPGDLAYHAVYISYEELNLVRERELVASIVAGVKPELQFSIPPDSNPRRTKRLKVAVVGVYPFEPSHSVGKMFGKLLCSLSRSLFDVVAMQLPPVLDASGKGACGWRTVVLAGSSTDQAVQHNAAAVLAERPDVVVYPEIGMDINAYALAAMRLAPVQITTHGHSATSGLPSIDYYVSFDTIEVPAAERHYSEQLVRLEGFHNMLWRPPPPPEPLPSRAQLGLPEEARPLLLCAQTMVKLHPRFDAVLANVLRALPDAHIVFLDGVRSAAPVRARWQAALAPDVVRRMHVLPFKPIDEFRAVLARADLALDTFPFGGATTSFEGFAVGLPVVTMPGQYLYGRFTRAMYERMGLLDEFVVGSEEEYVARVVALASDPPLLASLRAEVRERASLLFDDFRPLHEWERFLLRASPSPQ